jgi:hypothetical protein
MKFKMGHVASIGQWCETQSDTVFVSGQFDLRVRSTRIEQFLEPNGSIFEG